MPDHPPVEGLQVEPDQEPPATAQPAGQTATAPLHRGVKSSDPDTLTAKRRIRAAKLCATSLYTCPAALAGYFVGEFAGVGGLVCVAACGIAALVCGGLGLAGLHRAGPPPVDAAERPGLVRLSARMAQTAPTKAVIGLLGGALLAIGSIAVLVAIGFAGRG